MIFEIDVSGHDIFSKNYTIMVAEKNNNQRKLGFKMSDEFRKIIRSRQGQGFYRYSKSQKGFAKLKVRLYCGIVYFIFKELKKRYNLKTVSLEVCEDFPGYKNNIKQTLNHFLSGGAGIKGLGLEIESFAFLKLPKGSLADKYAFLVKNDTQNELRHLLCSISLDEIEGFLKN